MTDYFKNREKAEVQIYINGTSFSVP